MARTRSIKPGFFLNEKLAECDPLARLLFSGLWCHADREGRLENREKRIKASILPYDNCEIRSLLEQLQSRGFLIMFNYNGSKSDFGFIQIVNFVRHQYPNKREIKSTIPEPDLFGTSTELVQPPIRYKGKKVIRIKGLKVRDEFAKFAELYPHKVGMAYAEKCWGRAIKKSSLEEILAGLQRYVEKKPDDINWCNPSTFLNQERWRDQPAPKSNGKGNTHDKPGPVTKLFEGAARVIARRERERADNSGDDNNSPKPLLGSK